MSFPKYVERLQGFVLLPRTFVQKYIGLKAQRLIWRLLTVLSLLLLVVASYYAWHNLSRSNLHFDLQYIFIALGFYILSYVIQLFGWQSLTSRVFGRLPFWNNVYAVASSAMVKYLPTVAWYIANRVHTYERMAIPRKAVIAASLLEMIAMIISGTLLYIVLWVERFGFAFSLILFIVCVALVVYATHPRVQVGRLWHRFIRSHIGADSLQMRSSSSWLPVLLWYGTSWLLGGGMLWSTLQTVVIVEPSLLVRIMSIWLIIGLASYTLNLTLGVVGIARDITLSVLLSQIWPLPVAIASTIMVKLLLTLGEIVCSGIVLIGFALLRWKRPTSAI